MTRMAERIAVLESRVEALHGEHRNCLEAQIRLQTEVAILRTPKADNANPAPG
jgi:hypothetical protein